ncbi:unnamed protein product [Rotaria socialis]|uniref:ADP ribosyltransferase domain-containing protein n=1 Tax=Rotaria socialis TaxID=392032 RepID=A0A820ID24_9BILA|nr:unnamed protein product [Rotaria socialis]CAF3300795.1 unnamed protein product [Rotaria socialis]CAF4305510.1 unnamed protein product [Rotaria socialis]CAF4423459.1 unnamed protein product [Rotaria socialis]
MHCDVSDKEQIVYRGANLTDGILEEYKNAIDTTIQWLSFTSTSKVRQVSENFGNTLFIIRLHEKSLQSQFDLSSVSYYPEEQEVLLPISYNFHVDKIEHDSTSGKYLIYMTGNRETY